jgi:hypothetical protein
MRPRYLSARGPEIAVVSTKALPAPLSRSLLAIHLAAS